MKKKIVYTTLIFLVSGKSVFLSRKKRGFGVGYWNGYGGKRKKGESDLQCAKRELLEEAEVEGLVFKDAGRIRFTFEGEDFLISCKVFLVPEWEGEVCATPEMSMPKLFNPQDIPFEKMWPDDRFWLRKVLLGKRVRGSFHFGEDRTILRQKVTFSS